ncbi:hypothetical protein FRC17_000402 [Serendipita sp. 399]|nr:hypothetical protein FRC17_000402 [Serendipita sp. 399]
MSGTTNPGGAGGYHFPSTSTGSGNIRWRTVSTNSTNASWESATPPFSTMNQYDYQNAHLAFHDNEDGGAGGDERPSASSLRRLRRISGMFEQTAMDVQEGARNVLSTVIVPATETSREYAREQPFKATFIALVTFLSFVPVLLFLVFAIAVVVFATFTSLSLAISSATLAFILGAAFLAATLLLCVAPISLVATVITFALVSTYNLAQICLRYVKSKVNP